MLCRTYSNEQAHLGHWTLLARIERVRQIDERIVVAEHQIVHGQRDERLEPGHCEHQRNAARHKESKVSRLAGKRL